MAKKKKKVKSRAKKRVKKAQPKTLVVRKVARAESSEGVRRTKIRVIGIGGGGGNIVSEIAKGVAKVDFVAANTDLQAQKGLPKQVKGFVFGQEMTQGLGCGMDAVLGESAARAEKERIKKLVEDQDICILVACLGGGTGSGAVPVFAEAAREARCLCLGIFTLPFSFEGDKRVAIAQASLEKTVPLLNAYVLLPNENIFRVIDTKTPLRAAFSAVNKKLAETLEGFMETISLPGLINIDFADVKTLLEGRGRLAFLNSVQAQGPQKVQAALKNVLVNPLFDYGISGAERMIFNVSGDKDMKMQEVAEVSSSIGNHNPRARIIFGISFQPGFRGKLRIALFAIGCKKEEGRILLTHGAKKKTEYKNKKTKAQKREQTKKKEQTKPPLGEQKKEPSKLRRNALDLKKAQDQELEALEKKERQWDIPAFLRNRSISEPS